MARTAKSSEDPRLARVTELALSLPEAPRQIYGSHAQFLIRKKHSPTTSITITGTASSG